MRLTITGTQSINWQLKAKNAHITPTDSPRLFHVEPERPGFDTFTVLQNGKPILKKVFKIIPPPAPVVHWGTLNTDTATVMEVTTAGQENFRHLLS